MQKLKTLGRNIRGRVSSLRNAVAKDIIAMIPHRQLSDSELDKRAEILQLDKVGNKCVYCSINVASTIDHVIPLVVEKYPSGFGDNLWNTVPCCNQCNSSKNGKDLLQWLGGKSLKNPLLGKSDKERMETIDKFTVYSEIVRRKAPHLDVLKDTFDYILEPCVIGAMESEKRLKEFEVQQVGNRFTLQRC